MTSAKNDELPPEALKNLEGLRELRRIFGLSQEKLAERVGVTESRINAYESGRNVPTLENYSKLAEYFGWNESDDPPPPRKTFSPLKPSSAKPKPKPKPAQPKPVTVISPSKKKAVKVSFLSGGDPCRPRLNVSFTEGMCYEIHDGVNFSALMSLAIKQSRNSNGYIFRYEGMSGIHHVFREIRGKWIQTYTNAQLIGKYVKEAEE
ncbi:MAG: helix-turn-helix transcriptional regulator [Synergistaceae bacterium]|nr:helix-turn-helix transcriptional regulator [Synergistaceae bacterium]MBQ3758822.1 helix-turn-helix transcriptional regulator [Synergistaceae bacterium]